MAVYTDITDAELEAFLAEFDLGQALSCKGIAEGVENSNFLVETGAGRFILTVYERRVRKEELPYFLGLMQWLAQHGYPCAEPMAGRDGRLFRPIRGKPAALVEFLNGLSVRRPAVAHCREAGEGMAWLHQAADGFPGRRPNDLGQPSWGPMFSRMGEAADTLKPGLADVIGRESSTLAGPGRPSCRPGPFTPTSSPTTSSSATAGSPLRSTSISPATTPWRSTLRSR